MEALVVTLVILGSAWNLAEGSDCSGTVLPPKLVNYTMTTERNSTRYVQVDFTSDFPLRMTWMIDQYYPTTRYIVTGKGDIRADTEVDGNNYKFTLFVTTPRLKPFTSIWAEMVMSHPCNEIVYFQPPNFLQYLFDNNKAYPNVTKVAPKAVDLSGNLEANVTYGMEKPKYLREVSCYDRNFLDRDGQKIDEGYGIDKSVEKAISVSKRGTYEYNQNSQMVTTRTLTFRKKAESKIDEVILDSRCEYRPYVGDAHVIVKMYTSLALRSDRTLTVWPQSLEKFHYGEIFYDDEGVRIIPVNKNSKQLPKSFQCAAEAEAEGDHPTVRAARVEEGVLVPLTDFHRVTVLDYVFQAYPIHPRPVLGEVVEFECSASSGVEEATERFRVINTEDVDVDILTLDRGMNRIKIKDELFEKDFNFTCMITGVPLPDHVAFYVIPGHEVLKRDMFFSSGPDKDFDEWGQYRVDETDEGFEISTFREDRYIQATMMVKMTGDNPAIPRDSSTRLTCRGFNRYSAYYSSINLVTPKLFYSTKWL